MSCCPPTIWQFYQIVGRASREKISQKFCFKGASGVGEISGYLWEEKKRKRDLGRGRFQPIFSRRDFPPFFLQSKGRGPCFLHRPWAWRSPWRREEKAGRALLSRFPGRCRGR